MRNKAMCKILMRLIDTLTLSILTNKVHLWLIGHKVESDKEPVLGTEFNVNSRPSNRFFTQLVGNVSCKVKNSEVFLYSKNIRREGR